MTESIAELEFEAELRGTDPVKWQRLAEAQLRARNVPAARIALAKLESLPHLNFTSLSALAGLLERANDPAAARASWLRAAQAAPLEPDAHRRLGEVMQRSSDAGAAAFAVETAAVLRPRDPALQIAAAEALLAAGRSRHAQVYAALATELDPQNLAALRLLLRLKGDSPKQLETLALLERILALDPDDQHTASALATRLAGLGKRDAALQILDRFVGRPPATTEAAIERARALRAAGRTEQAEQLLRQALQKEPESAAAHFALGEALEQSGRRRDALERYRSAVDRAPTWAEALFALGRTLKLLDEVGEATDVLVRAAAADPSSPEIRELLSQLLAQAAREETSSQITFGGDLSVFSLPEMLDFLCHQRRSGQILLSSGNATGVVDLENGFIRDVRAPNGTRLLGLLVARELISSEDADRLRGGGDPADYLIAQRIAEQRLVPKERLVEAIQTKVQRVLHELVAWRTGQAAFHRDETQAAIEIDPDLLIDTRWALIEVMRQIDESERLA